MSQQVRAGGRSGRDPDSLEHDLSLPSVEDPEDDHVDELGELLGICERGKVRSTTRRENGKSRNELKTNLQ